MSIPPWTPDPSRNPNWEPWIVLGPGRSGTSTVARILASLGVSMGPDRPPDEGNPAGYFEDQGLRIIDRVRANPSFEGVKGDIDERAWHLSFEGWLVKRRREGLRWGFKEPSFSRFVNEVRPLFRWSRVIRCRRDRTSVVASCERRYGEGWADEVAAREEALDDLEQWLARERLPEPLEIDFSERVPEETVRAAILFRWPELAQEVPSRRPRVLLSTPTTGWIHKAVALARETIIATEARRGQVDLLPILPQHNPLEHNQMRICRQVLREDYDFWVSFDADNPPRRGVNPIDLCFLDLPLLGLPTPVWRNTDGPEGGTWPIYWTALGRVEWSQVEEADPESRLKLGAGHEERPLWWPEGWPAGFRPLRGPPPGHDLEQVGGIGGGCWVMRRDVIQEMVARYQNPFQRLWTPEGLVEMGNDFVFSARCHEAAIPLYTHWAASCEHINELPLGEVQSMAAMLVEQTKKEPDHV